MELYQNQDKNLYLHVMKIADRILNLKGKSIRGGSKDRWPERNIETLSKCVYKHRKATTAKESLR